MPSHSKDSGDGGEIDNRRCLGYFQGIILMLAAIGLFNLMSSTPYMNMENEASALGHVYRHVFYLCVGGLAWTACSRMPFSVWKHSIGPLVALTLFLLLLVPLCGAVVNGAKRWLVFGPISMQPSELAKLVAVMWAASRLETLIGEGRHISFLAGFWHWFRHAPFHGKMQTGKDVLRGYVPLFAPLLMAAFVICQPDMGTAMLIIGFPVFLYILCGAPASDILISFLIAFAGICLLIAVEPYRMERIEILYDPFSDAAAKGYQTVQSLTAVGSGGIFGQGAGAGLAKYLYLPEQHTDFAFAVWSQEWGFLGSFLVLFLFLMLFFLGFKMAREIPRIYPALLVYGLTLLICGEGLFNIAMVIGIAPVTGVPLPFISYGGTSLVVNMIAVGIIGSAVRYGEEMREKDERERKLAVLAGEPVSLRRLSGAVFEPSRKGF